MKTTWRKLESWRPVIWNGVSPPRYAVFQRPLGRDRCLVRAGDGAIRSWKTRAAALRAANKQNQKEGLPQVE